MPRHTDDQQREEPNDASRYTVFLDRVKQFVENQSVSLDGGWPVVTEADMKEMNELVQKLIELRFDEDCDGDLPVRFQIIDRTRYEAMHYYPLKHEHQAESMEDFMRIMHMAQMNLSIAHDDFNRLWRILEYRTKEKTE